MIERAAIVAEGADSAAILGWIAAHDGEPEDAAAATSASGLHSARDEGIRASLRKPLRYVLPPEALS